MAEKVQKDVQRYEIRANSRGKEEIWTLHQGQRVEYRPQKDQERFEGKGEVARYFETWTFCRFKQEIDERFRLWVLYDEFCYLHASKCTEEG